MGRSPVKQRRHERVGYVDRAAVQHPGDPADHGMVTPERRRVARSLWLAALIVLGAACDTGETDFDGEEALAAVAIWHLVGPWRQAIPEGTPPADVTTREQQLIECLAGTRAITNSGWCVSD